MSTDQRPFPKQLSRATQEAVALTQQMGRTLDQALQDRKSGSEFQPGLTLTLAAAQSHAESEDELILTAPERAQIILNRVIRRAGEAQQPQSQREALDWTERVRNTPHIRSGKDTENFGYEDEPQMGRVGKAVNTGGFSLKTASDPEERQPQVAGEMDTLKTRLASLAVLLLRLRTRLEPALHEECCEECEALKETYLAPLAGQIRQQRYSVEQQIRLVEDLLDRVEL